MLAWIIVLLFMVILVSLAWQSLALRQQVEMLTSRLGAIERGQNKHQEAERRRRDYEIGFLESKVWSLQRSVDAFHARFDIINDRDDDPGARVQANQIRSINRRALDDDQQKFANEISAGGETMRKGRDLVHLSSSPYFSGRSAFKRRASLAEP